MKPYVEDIICALATPSGRGAVSIVRVSGKDSFFLLRKLLPQGQQIKNHFAHYLKLYFKEEFIDEILLISFPEGKSFTGEESFEIQCHGSPLIVSRIIEVLCALGCRLAEPGEFSFRAYSNGKMDLTKAEGIHYTIQAQSEISKALSLNLIEGGFKKSIVNIKENLVWAASRVEASIDFSDQDIDLNHDKKVFDKILQAKEKINEMLKSFSLGNVQAKGVKVSLVGPPNSGKSTLFNKLLEEERSIISEIKGTTRDYISAPLSLFEQTVELIDTAGLRESTDYIEQEGIKRSKKLIEISQLVLFLVSQDTVEESQIFYKELQTLKKDFLILETKQDKERWSSPFTGPKNPVSSLEEKSILNLKKEIYGFLKPYFESQNNLFVNRHRELLEIAKENLDKLVSFPALEGFEDVISSLLYSAIESLDEIMYIDDPEAVRDKIFKDFCLGK